MCCTVAPVYVSARAWCNLHARPLFGAGGRAECPTPRLPFSAGGQIVPGRLDSNNSSVMSSLRGVTPQHIRAVLGATALLPCAPHHHSPALAVTLGECGPTAIDSSAAAEPSRRFQGPGLAPTTRHRKRLTPRREKGNLLAVAAWRFVSQTLAGFCPKSAVAAVRQLPSLVSQT